MFLVAGPDLVWPASHLPSPGDPWQVTRPRKALRVRCLRRGRESLGGSSSRALRGRGDRARGCDLPNPSWASHSRRKPLFFSIFRRCQG
jgi:hypothetical protein